LNEDCADYVYRRADCHIPEGVAEALSLLKAAGYLLIVITNQAGIAKRLYTRSEVQDIFDFIQESTGHHLHALYFCPHHPQYDTQSLLRKPDSLMIEKAMAKYQIDPAQSWMVGDAERDVLAGQKAGVRTIHITTLSNSPAEKSVNSLLEAARYILSNEYE